MIDNKDNVSMTNIRIKMTTREALRNLFNILDIEGNTFDDRMMELATRAFSACADLDKHRKTLRKRGDQRAKRHQMEIKELTAERLKDLHGKLFPYLPWTSWDWYLSQLADMADDQLHVKKENVDVFSG